MALEWTDKMNNVDDVVAKDANSIAHSILDLEDFYAGKGWQTPGYGSGFGQMFYRKVENVVQVYIEGYSGKHLSLIHI